MNLFLEPQKCPVVSCQPGYKKVLKGKKTSKSQKYHAFITPMMSGITKTKSSNVYSAVKSVKSGYKGGKLY